MLAARAAPVATAAVAATVATSIVASAGASLAGGNGGGSPGGAMSAVMGAQRFAMYGRLGPSGDAYGEATSEAEASGSPADWMMTGQLGLTAGWRRLVESSGDGGSGERSSGDRDSDDDVSGDGDSDDEGSGDGSSSSSRNTLLSPQEREQEAAVRREEAMTADRLARLIERLLSFVTILLGVLLVHVLLLTFWRYHVNRRYYAWQARRERRRRGGYERVRVLPSPRATLRATPRPRGTHARIGVEGKVAQPRGSPVRPSMEEAGNGPGAGSSTTAPLPAERSDAAAHGGKAVMDTDALAMMRLQRMYRQRRAILEVSTRREERLACQTAVRLQAAIRARHARRHVQRTLAVIRIQAAMRRAHALRQAQGRARTRLAGHTESADRVVAFRAESEVRVDDLSALACSPPASPPTSASRNGDCDADQAIAVTRPTPPPYNADPAGSEQEPAAEEAAGLSAGSAATVGKVVVSAPWKEVATVLTLNVKKHAGQKLGLGLRKAPVRGTRGWLGARELVVATVAMGSVLEGKVVPGARLMAVDGKALSQWLLDIQRLTRRLDTAPEVRLSLIARPPVDAPPSALASARGRGYQGADPQPRFVGLPTALSWGCPELLVLIFSSAALTETAMSIVAIALTGETAVGLWSARRRFALAMASLVLLALLAYFALELYRIRRFAHAFRPAVWSTNERPAECAEVDDPAMALLARLRLIKPATREMGAFEPTEAECVPRRWPLRVQPDECARSYVHGCLDACSPASRPLFLLLACPDSWFTLAAVQECGARADGASHLRGAWEEARPCLRKRLRLRDARHIRVALGRVGAECLGRRLPLWASDPAPRHCHHHRHVHPGRQRRRECAAEYSHRLHHDRRRVGGVRSRQRPAAECEPRIVLFARVCGARDHPMGRPCLQGSWWAVCDERF